MVEDVLLKSTFPQLLPAGASGGPPPLVWSTDNAMVARSARSARREAESRSTEKDGRLLTKRRNEGQWRNTWETLLEREKAKKIHQPRQCRLFFGGETDLSHDGPHRSRSAQTVTSFFIPK